MKNKVYGLIATLTILGGVSVATLFATQKPAEMAAESAKKETKAAVPVTFKTSVDYPFSDGTFEKTVTVTKEALETNMLPMFDYSTNYSLSSWQGDDGVEYSTSDLLRKAFYSGSATFTAQAVAQGQGTDLYESRDTISERAASIGSTSLSTGKIYTVPAPGGASGSSKEYTLNAAGFQEALYELYSSGNATTDYVVYVGGNVTGLPTTIGAKGTSPSTSSDISFYALNGKIKSLTITGSSSDPVNNTAATSAPSGVGSLALPATVNFNTDVELRNISYSGAGTMAANGYSITLGGGAYATTATTLYGGSSDGTSVTRSSSRASNIVIASAGVGSWNVYGGNDSGSYTGDTSVAVLNTGTTTISTLVGGNNTGTVTGNTHLSVHHAATITDIYGGTIDGTVKGNVSNYIYSTNSAFTLATNYYGGARDGVITGNIENFVTGLGRFNIDYWNGGSRGGTTAALANGIKGNVGTSGANNTITNIVDLSLASAGNVRFNGGNDYSGIVHAKLINTVRANTTSAAGTFYSVNGGTGYRALNITGMTAVNIDGASTAADPTASRVAIAKNGAKLQYYGGGDTHMLGGMMGGSGGEASYAHATGFAGYYEGDYNLVAGIENSDTTKSGGYNYVYGYGSRTVTDLTYRVSPAYDSASANRTENSGWDIFGGTGGSVGAVWGGFTYGDTSIVINNALARWTYGGGYSGVIIGNTSHTLNAGLVDTLEGGGYFTQRIYGNNYATMHNGEVNFFFSGGGWNDRRVEGNAYTLCTGGYLNAPVGGTYGLDGQVITGDSEVTITGGNFEGTKHPSHATAGAYGISGGPTYYGNIEGDITLTIDLREAKDFQLPKGLSITGGRPDSANAVWGKIGTAGKDNKITLNVYTSADNDVLNGAVIYGDGGATYANTNSTQIIMNIDTPGATIGRLYATQYNNVLSNKLLRNVEINIKNGGAIGGLSGGSATDNINNTVYAASAAEGKGVAVRIGASEINASEPIIDEPISFTGVGLINFTSLKIENRMTALAAGGNIKNGFSATAANHGTTYQNFGDITVTDGAGFGVTTANNIISGANLIVEGEGHIYSTPGTGIINLSDVTFSNSNSRLTWHKQAGGAATLASTGTYFGSANAYQVLTINPTITNATSITPFNFMGVEDSSGKTFVGDNDVTKTGSGYGIMIPGAVIDYEIVDADYDPMTTDIQDVVVNGQGYINHDVTEIKENNQPLTLDVWGTETSAKTVGKDGSPVSHTGRMIIPVKTGVSILPEFTFTPETSTTGSWIKELEVISTKTDGSLSDTIGEQTTSDPLKWKMAATGNEYSYKIKVTYTNKAELKARDVIITASEAAALTDISEVTDLNEAVGRPHFATDVDASKLDTIKSDLGDDVSRKYPVTYSVKDQVMSRATKKCWFWAIENVGNWSPKLFRSFVFRLAIAFHSI